MSTAEVFWLGVATGAVGLLMAAIVAFIAGDR